MRARQSFVSGLVMGASTWAVASFAVFHALHGLGAIESELAWALVQGLTAAAMAGGAVWVYFTGR